MKNKDVFQFFVGDNETAELYRTKDWSKTPLGNF